MASASDTGLASTRAASWTRLVSSVICQSGGSQSQSSKSRALPPALLSSLLLPWKGLGEMEAWSCVWGMPGPRKAVWKAAGWEDLLKFFPPSWGSRGRLWGLCVQAP